METQALGIGLRNELKDHRPSLLGYSKRVQPRRLHLPEQLLKTEPYFCPEAARVNPFCGDRLEIDDATHLSFLSKSH